MGKVKLKLKGAFEVRACDKKESVNSKCEKRLGMRNQEIMRTGLSARGSLIWPEEQGRAGQGGAGFMARSCREVESRVG